MTKCKINDNELLRLIDREGRTQVEVARRFGCTKQAVNKRLQELRGQQTRAVATAKIKESLDVGFDAMRQLAQINAKVLELLDSAEDDTELSLKCIGEVRQQIRLASDIYERMFNIKVVYEFMQIVSDTMREVNPHVYRDFKNRINEHRAVRSALRFT